MRNPAVVTVVSGRHEHLQRQREALAALEPPPDLHVVVSMGDPQIGQVLQETHKLPTLHLQVGLAPEGLPLAAARNAGAAAAIEAGAELLVMLDVDCLPGPHLLDAYLRAATALDADALLAGPVTYLPPTPPGGWTPGALSNAGPPHAARPVPPAGVMQEADHRLFWSLSFALTTATWQRVGGFHTGYVGYGGEDTDFAMKAQAAGVPMLWVGGADAYHQHHPVSSPPVEHVSAILRNGGLFAQRWGWWPMQGWLADFESLGLVQNVGGDWIAAAPLRLASVPARHPYVDGIRPCSAEPVHPDRVAEWAPDPLLEVEYTRSVASDLDVLHVHFGYDHLQPAQLEAWLALVTSRRIPLVLTVHDLRNPHHAEPERHTAALRLLTAAAAEVITLTADAAAEIARCYQREARVLAHPTLLAEGDVRVTEPGRVVMALKSLRRNVVAPDQLILAAGIGALRGGGQLEVGLHADVASGPEFDRIEAAAEVAGAKLSVHERWRDDELISHLSRAHACVLPYRFGSHSGLLELCRDVGTRVIAPSCGFYRGQWDDVVSYTNDERVGFDPLSLTVAVEGALRTPAPSPADRSARLAQRAHLRADHELLYRGLVRR